MSADHDALIRTATQLAQRIAMLHTLEALRREKEKHLDDSEARMLRTRQRLAGSAALLRQSRALGHESAPPVTPSGIARTHDGGVTRRL